VDEHAVVSAEDWASARRALLAKEKEFTRLREELAWQRRELPWEEVTTEYFFEGADGTRSLPQLFDGRSQLIVYHFMFPPGWDAGCPHCSFWADNFNGTLEHLHARDISLVAVSRAPITRLTAYRERMGWMFPWYSTPSIEFNHDFHVTFTPDELAGGTAVYNYGSTEPGMADREGVSVFFASAGRVFHTYSAYARGIDMLNGAYHYMDLVPRGRDEAGHPGDPQFWVRRHDEYGN
jgi:predicted dithiol-disulfide oxidoreductase (DUF899 family)